MPATRQSIRKDFLNTAANCGIRHQHASGGDFIIDLYSTSNESPLVPDQTLAFIADLIKLVETLIASAKMHTEQGANTLRKILKYKENLQAVFENLEKNKQTASFAYQQLIANSALKRLTQLLAYFNDNNAVKEAVTSSLDDNGLSPVISAAEFIKYKSHELTPAQPAQSNQAIPAVQTIEINANVWHSFTKLISASTSSWLNLFRFFDKKNKTLRAVHQDGLKKFPPGSKIPLKYIHAQLHILRRSCLRSRYGSTATTKSFAALQQAITDYPTIQYITSKGINANLPDFVLRSPRSNPNETTGTQPVDTSVIAQRETNRQHKNFVEQLPVASLLKAKVLARPLITNADSTLSLHPAIEEILGRHNLADIENIRYPWAIKLIQMQLTNNVPIAQHQAYVRQILETTTIARFAGVAISDAAHSMSILQKITAVCDLAEALLIISGDETQPFMWYNDISPSNLAWDGETAKLIDLDSIERSNHTQSAERIPSFYPHPTTLNGEYTAHQITQVGIASMLAFLSDETAYLSLLEETQTKSMSNHIIALKELLNTMQTSRDEDKEIFAATALACLNQDDCKSAQDLLNILQNTRSTIVKPEHDMRNPDTVINKALDVTATPEFNDRQGLLHHWSNLPPAANFNDRFSMLCEYIVVQQNKPISPTSCLPPRRSVNANIFKSELHHPNTLFAPMPEPATVEAPSTRTISSELSGYRTDHTNYDSDDDHRAQHMRSRRQVNSLSCPLSDTTHRDESKWSVAHNRWVKPAVPLARSNSVVITYRDCDEYDQNRLIRL